MLTKSNNVQYECNCNNNEECLEMNGCVQNIIPNENDNKKEFQLLISKNKYSTRAPYASYYSSKELPTSIYESPYDIYEDENTIPTPIKLIGKNIDGYRNALKHGFIRSFVCTGERPLVKRHHTFYSSFKDSALSVSSSHLELLRSVDNDSNCKQEISQQPKDNYIQQQKSPFKQKPLFKTTQMVYVKSKPKPCSLNINKKTPQMNSNNTPVHLNKTPPHFESNYTQTINLTCNTNLNRSIQEINSNSFIIIDDNDNNNFDDNCINQNNNNNNNNNANTNYNNPIKNNKLCSIQTNFNNLRINNNNNEQQQFQIKDEDSSYISNNKEDKHLFTTPSQLGSTSRTTTKNNSEATTIFKRKSQIMKDIEHTKISKEKVIDMKVKEVRIKEIQRKKMKNTNQSSNNNSNTNKVKYITKRNVNRNDLLLPSSTSISSLAKPKIKIYPSSYNNNKIASTRLKYPIKFDYDNFITSSYWNKYKNNTNIYNDNIFLRKHSNIYHALNK